MPKPWWKDFYEETFSDLYLYRDAASLRQTVDFLKKSLHVKKGMTLFDQCSGIGNVSHTFARQGIRTIGVEQCKPYVDSAKDVAAAEKLPCQFFRGDARTFVSPEPCDAAINWYTSFGHSLSDTDNVEMLKCAYESLKNKGYFALDFHNVAFILQQPLTSTQIKTNTHGKEYSVMRSSSFDLAKGSYASTWTYRSKEGELTEHAGTTRVYMPHQLREMLTVVGFHVQKIYGDYAGGPLTMKSPRCIIVAQK